MCSDLQVYLTAGEDAAIASSLVQTYLRLFEIATNAADPKDTDKKKGRYRKGGNKNHKSGSNNAASALGNPGARLLSALLTGVNRARPYLPPGDPGVEGRTASLFRAAHTGGFATATQALSLLFQVKCCTLTFLRQPKRSNNIFARVLKAMGLF